MNESLSLGMAERQWITAPLERQSVSLRLSVTSRCQLRCLYCRPDGEINSAKEKLLQSDHLIRFIEIVQRRFGVSKIRLTGGEPLLRPDLFGIIESISNLEIEDLALTTNAQLLGRFAASLKLAGLNRVNISLDSLKPSVFEQLAGSGSLELTLKGIAAALIAGLSPVRLNTVILRGLNDTEAVDLVSFAIKHGCELRFIELMPTGLSLDDYRRFHFPTNELFDFLASHFDMRQLFYETASSARRYSVVDSKGRKGTVGFISPINHPFCVGCRRLRLTAVGGLIGCLARPECRSISELLKSSQQYEDTLVETIERALLRKRGAEDFMPAGPMSAIGG